jgi:hypothetical protein
VLDLAVLPGRVAPLQLDQDGVAAGREKQVLGHD